MTLLIATQERINGVNVFKDDQSPYRYYLIADQPRIRQRDDHTLAFRFMAAPGGGDRAAKPAQ